MAACKGAIPAVSLVLFSTCPDLASSKLAAPITPYKQIHPMEEEESISTLTSPMFQLRLSGAAASIRQ